MNSRLRGFLLLVIWACGTALSTSPVRADRETELTRYREARRLYESNLFQASRDLVDRVVAAAELTDRERSEAWILKGLCESNLGNKEAAVQAYMEGLMLNSEVRVAGSDYVEDEIANFQTAYSRWKENGAGNPRDKTKEAPAQATPPTNPSATPQGPIRPPDEPGRPFWKDPRFFVPGGVAALVVIAILLDRPEDEVTTGSGGLPPFPRHP